MGFDVHGLRRLAADLRDVAAQAGPVVDLVVRKTAFDIERDAKILAPVDTGNLRTSISTDVAATNSTVSAEIGPTANYGLFLEVGTSRMAPRPYMGPALDRNTPAFDAAMAQIVDRFS
ncbi:phage protein, HK97 gp10 family [Xylanimonas cellulosilytica DSM 15894]|uniref:Phage protein, HK97 gp10 family n=1 Tax=Xylanimonas cellulosilytica (strain DSM 15894 / JCM 12276 / CECT 5975 / KCTC 9989 / LMG 20990 / NBRC 107835 / XIL07) TaxID=446471 RepID=D1BW68_XYLCX|nr:HK97-gp10 family putative phage morphogenesis protein [Xylanimonas cellulosilytica]ACZ29571.1 phage protein, HK97 gp10 family [Xylanimonas cellulosilytica DSM 15894]